MVRFPYSLPRGWLSLPEACGSLRISTPPSKKIQMIWKHSYLWLRSNLTEVCSTGGRQAEPKKDQNTRIKTGRAGGGVNC